MKKTAINWYKVEVLMRKSVTGTVLTSEEFNYIGAVYRTDPDKYGILSKSVRKEEQDKVNLFRD